MLMLSLFAQITSKLRSQIAEDNKSKPRMTLIIFKI